MLYVELTDTVLDLEVETHLKDSEQEFLNYIESLLKCEQVKNKYDELIRLSSTNNKKLAHYLLNDNMTRLFVLKYFNDKVYSQLLNLVKRYI